MPTLAQRNDAAMRSAQRTADGANPPDDRGRSGYIDNQVELLLSDHDADHVWFAGIRGADNFAEAATEALWNADANTDSTILRMLIAVRRGDLERAQSLAEQFDTPLPGDGREHYPEGGMSASEMEWAKAKADSLIRQMIDKVADAAAARHESMNTLTIQALESYLDHHAELQIILGALREQLERQGKLPSPA